MTHSNLPTQVIDDLVKHIDKGYDASQNDNAIKASEIWLGAWEQIKGVMETYDFSYVEDFDDVLKSNASLFNWSQDLEMELLNASREKMEFLKDRMDFCKEYLSKSKQKNGLNNLVRRRVIAESHFMLGHPKEGDRLFKEHVHQFPEDAFGWINWSDQYGLFAENEQIRDYHKAIAILKQGLEVPGLDERVDTLDRLLGTYEKAGMSKEAEDTKREMESAQRTKHEEQSEQQRQLSKKIQQELEKDNTNQKPKNESVKQKKVGRNDPCPCGSGKKYKKCCGG